MPGSRQFVREVFGAPVVPPGRVTRALVRLRSGLATAHRFAPPPVQVLEAMFGLFDNRVLLLLVELGIPEALDHPMNAIELAARTDTDAAQLDRVLRFAAGRGFVGWDRRGRYRPNGVTEVLRRDHTNSWRGWVEFAGSDWFWQAWRHVDVAVRSGTGSGIEAATGHAFFDYVNRINPQAGTDFNEAMRAGGTLQGLALARGLEWKGIETVCDVGGGTGAALGVIGAMHPQLRGTLFDLPDVVSTADLTAPNVTAVGGDFFAAVPAGLDRYLLLAVIHDWNDDEAARILRTVGRAAGTSGEIVVVEGVLGDHPRNDALEATDLLMLVVGSGRERTQAQFDALYRASGLTLQRQVVLPSGFTAFVLRAARDQ
jgi:hypothetical protein